MFVFLRLLIGYAKEKRRKQVEKQSATSPKNKSYNKRDRKVCLFYWKDAGDKIKWRHPGIPQKGRFRRLRNKKTVVRVPILKHRAMRGQPDMATYSKNEFRESREAQYKYFQRILAYSVFGIAGTLVFLMFMLKYAWS